MHRPAWRVVITPAASGAWNMALDEAILELAGRKETLPTLRLYAWSPPCLSLGYAQPSSDVDITELQARGWDLVRRPTGGRAILHTDELTYSVCGPQDEPHLAGSVLESYRVLSQALVLALHRLGIAAQAHEKPHAQDPKKNSAEQNPVCFEVPSNYEITVDGKKLIGSAQARRKEGVLQHGSLPLYGDLTRITSVLVFRDEQAVSAQATRQRAAERLLERATTAETCLGSALAWDVAAQALISAFRDALDLDLVSGEPTRAELERAENLQRDKFAHPDWTGIR